MTETSSCTSLTKPVTDLWNNRTDNQKYLAKTCLTVITALALCIIGAYGLLQMQGLLPSAVNVVNVPTPAMIMAFAFGVPTLIAAGLIAKYTKPKTETKPEELKETNKNDDSKGTENKEIEIEKVNNGKKEPPSDNVKKGNNNNET